ncbi:IS3 family transposase [Bradyrhizobium sp. 138]|nr:IS3 family transposase [Bradyrhizobium sp. 138]
MLKAEGLQVNRKRVQRLMRKMGIAALGPKPNTTKPAPGHKIYPYLLRNMTIDRPNQVWAADITYGELVLPRCARRRSGTVWQAGDLQHRPRQPIHECGLHRRVGGRRDQDLNGWPRSLDGQCRAVVAVSQA